MLRLTIRGLLAHKIRFLMTGVAVIIGVAFMSGSLILTDTIQRTFDELFANIYAQTDAVVRADASFGDDLDQERPDLDASLVSEVSAVDGVATAAGTVQSLAAIIDTHTNELVSQGGRGAPSLGFSWVDDSDLSQFHVVDGHAPQADDEIVIDARSARLARYEPGDTVPVITRVGRRDYRLAGIVKFGDQEAPVSASVVAFTPTAAQEVLGQPGKIESIVVRAEDGVSQADIASRIERRLAATPDVEVITGEQIIAETQDDLAEELSFFTTFLLVFAGIALFVGSFIIFNTFSILVAQRSREMAVLRAVGAGRGQVFRAVTLEAVASGVVASCLGLGAGVLLARGLKALLGGFGLSLPDGDTVFQPSTAVISLAVGVTVTVVAAVVPAFKASRVPPVAAMREVAIDRSATSRWRIVIGLVVAAAGTALVLVAAIDRGSDAALQAGVGGGLVFLGVTVLGPMIARPISRVIGSPIRRLRGKPGDLAVENALRNPKRTAGTAAALMIGVGLVSLILVLTSSTKESFLRVLQRVVTADYVVANSDFRRGGFGPEVEERLRTIPGVEAVSRLRRGDVSLDDVVEDVGAYDTTTASRLLDLDVIDGSLESLGSDEIGVHEDLATAHGWHVGDRLPARFAETGDATLTVRAIYREEGPAEGVTMDAAAFATHFPDGPARSFFIAVEGGATPATTRAITDALSDYPGSEARTSEQYSRAQTERLDPLVGLVLVLLALSVVIALVGIYNTLGLSVYERTRELGLLRAIGMSRAQMRSMVRWESVIVALLGTVLGLLIGLGFGWVMALALQDQGLDQLVFPWGQLVAVVGIAAICGLIAAVLPARRAGRLDVLTAIATE